MPSTIQDNVPPRFQAGTRLGRCVVAAFLGREPLGERYAVFYGTTNHVLDLVVPPLGSGGPTLEDYRAYMRRIEPVSRHPALAHCFAAGSDPCFNASAASRDGFVPDSNSYAVQVPWMRTEHVPGVPQWIFNTQFDEDILRKALPPPGPNEDAATREAREHPDIPNLALYIAAAQHRADAGELGRLLGDVLGALSALHRAKLPGGNIDSASVALDRTPHSAKPVARLVRYAEAEWSDAAAASDLAAFSALVREACLALPENSSTASKFGAFAEKTDSGAFPTAAEAYTEWLAMLSSSGFGSASSGGAVRRSSGGTGRGGASHSSRSSESSSSSRRRHRDRKPTFSLLSSDSDAARRVKAALGACGFTATIIAIGFGVYTYMTWTDNQSRERYARTFMADAPVVTVIPTETVGVERETGAAAAYRLSAPELASARITGDPFARARVAMSALLDSAPEAPTAAVIAEADSALAAILPDLLDSPAEDMAAAFLRGAGALLALGRPSEPAVAWRELETAATAGFPLAAVMFGDLICGGASRAMPEAAPDGAVPRAASLRDERALDFYLAAADALDAPQNIRQGAEERIAALLRRAPRSSSASFVNKWRPWVDKAAGEGNIHAMSLLAVSGPFCATNATEALDWLRRINRSSAANPAVKAWAQTRMAARFARGAGTPASDSAARVWYERAAKLGNGAAMRRWADYLESGKGDPNGLGNPDAAAEWREKARDAAPEPDFQPAWWPLSRPIPREED